MLYRKKPITVDAMRYAEDGSNWREICLFIGATIPEEADNDELPPFLDIETLEGVMEASWGDWVIREPFPSGGRQFYPCKPDIFVKTYEGLRDQPVPPTVVNGTLLISALHQLLHGQTTYVFYSPTDFHIFDGADLTPHPSHDVKLELADGSIKNWFGDIVEVKKATLSGLVDMLAQLIDGGGLQFIDGVWSCSPPMTVRIPLEPASEIIEFLTRLHEGREEYHAKVEERKERGDPKFKVAFRTMTATPIEIPDPE